LLCVLVILIILKKQFCLENGQTEGTPQNCEQRIDLIKFYNTIFVQVVQNSALKYSLNNSVSCLNVDQIIKVKKLIHHFLLE